MFTPFRPPTPLDSGGGGLIERFIIAFARIVPDSGGADRRVVDYPIRLPYALWRLIGPAAGSG
jgi:hypothetical protein